MSTVEKAQQQVRSAERLVKSLELSLQEAEELLRQAEASLRDAEAEEGNAFNGPVSSWEDLQAQGPVLSMTV